MNYEINIEDDFNNVMDSLENLMEEFVRDSKPNFAKRLREIYDQVDEIRDEC